MPNSDAKADTPPLQASSKPSRKPWWDVAFEAHLAALLLALMTIIAFAGTVSRYVFSRGIPYLEQFTPELFVWASFLGAAAAARQRAHLGSDVLVAMLPRPWQRLLRWLSLLLSLGFFGVLIYYGVLGMRQDMRFGFTNALGIGNYWITAALPVAGLLLVLRSLQAFFRPEDEEDVPASRQIA